MRAGLVLCLQVLTLLSVLHCLSTAGHVESVFSDSVFSAAVRRNKDELPETTSEKKVLYANYLCRPCACSYSRHDLPSLETAPTSSALHLMARLSHLGIARDVPRKPHRSRRSGRNERRKIKVIVGFHDRLPSDSSSSPTALVNLPSLTFTVSIQLSSLTLTRVNTIPLAAAPPSYLSAWPPHSLFAQRSAASPSQTAASHSPWFLLSQKHTTCLPFQ